MGRERILVVDDEPAVRALLADMLQDAGYAVTVAATGPEAIEALERVEPALVISDVSMPGMDGFQLYAEVRRRPRWVSVPFLFLSGRTGEREVREGMRLGADDYLTKPVAEADLLVAVRARLDRRAQLEAAYAAQLDVVKDAILETLNHEFRTPLTVLIGYGQMLRDFGGQLTPEKLVPVVDGILAGSARLERLVQDLVLLVDLQSGAARRAYEARQAPIGDLPEMLAELVAAHRERAQARGLRVETEVPATLPPVRGQRELLSAAMGRLLDNAVKFSRPGGTITVGASADGGSVRLRVSDTGVGIAPDEIERIAELFYQVDRERTQQQGLGTGLTVARGIAHLHGGRLGVTSTPGSGATFTIDLPADRSGA